MNELFFLGLMICCGFIGGKIVNLVKLPGVVGYLLVGVFLGPSFLGIFNMSLLESLGSFNEMTLGLVAFVIGSEMKMSVLNKVGKGIVAIIFAESFGAFFLVFGGVYLLTHKIYLALIFGAMAPASAPAGTAIVLQEYKARGPLTNMLYAVVGLDDGLAIIIYAFAAALAKLSITGTAGSLTHVIAEPLKEILGAIILGAGLGFILGVCLKKITNKKDILAITVGAIMICSGIANYFQVSLILANLSLGMMFTNFFVFENERSVETINFITLPLYIIFFLIAGAHLQVSLLPAMGLLGIVYIVCRTVGLISGAYIGATLANEETVIRKYLGLGILSQAGVAIGLAIMASQDFSVLGKAGNDMAIMVINTIAATTIVFEIFGPIATKFAIQRAGEIKQ